MMGGVQNAPPEDPDAFALYVKKGNDFQPAFLIASREPRESRATQLFVAPAKRLRCKLLGNERCRFEFSRKTHEFREEAPLGKELVLHDLDHRG